MKVIWACFKCNLKKEESKNPHAPLPLTTTIPMSDPLHFLASFLAESADTIREMCTENCQSPEGIWALIARCANVLQAELGDCSVLDMLAVVPAPTTPAPPTAPSLPQEELWLSAPPLTQPLPCWLAKSRSSLLKSTAPGPLPRWPLPRNPLPNPPLSPMPSLPLPPLPPLPLALHPPPLPQW